MVDFLPRRKKRILRKKIFYIIVLIFVIGWIYYIYNINSANSKNSAIKKFVIESGQGSVEISQQLEAEGLIKGSLVFQLYIWQKGISSRLQDGEYFLAQNLNIKQVAQILNRGAGVTKEKVLTFIEGWNNQQYADYLAQQGFGKQKDFFAVIQRKATWWDDYNILTSRPRNLDLEGYLFPDTYRVYSDASLEDIAKKMLNNLESKLTPELSQEISNQGKTIHEILTLASILEREVSSDNDRKMTADIFYKRLEAGMPLQADSTVNYITGKKVTRISNNDKQIDSPYNTYKYKGLIPGPICNPSLSAIKAAIFPRPNPYWYFLTTPDGQVIYSKTHEEHVAAKAKYYK